jgi:hypothetical protein
MEHHILHDLHDLSHADIEPAEPVRNGLTSDSSRAFFVLFAFALGVLGFLVFRR